MKVITDCKVTVVGHTIFKEHPDYDIPDDGTSIERLGAFAAKGCYDSFSKNGRSCLDNQRQIIEYAHGSVLEHSCVSVYVEGVTRGLTLELNRHRPFNISQRSTRYTKEEDSAFVLEPYYASLWDINHMSWNNHLQEVAVPDYIHEFPVPHNSITAQSINEVKLVLSSIDNFKRCLKQYASAVAMLERLNPRNLEGYDLRKWARGKARNDIPHGLETRGVWTANFRAWRWFIESRSNRHAEAEIRRLAAKVLAAIKPLAPVYFEDFELTGIIDDIEEYTPRYRKI